MQWFGLILWPFKSERNYCTFILQAWTPAEASTHQRVWHAMQTTSKLLTQFLDPFLLNRGWFHSMQKELQKFHRRWHQQLWFLPQIPEGQNGRFHHCIYLYDRNIARTALICLDYILCQIPRSPPNQNIKSNIILKIDGKELQQTSFLKRRCTRLSKELWNSRTFKEKNSKDNICRPRSNAETQFKYTGWRRKEERPRQKDLRGTLPSEIIFYDEKKIQWRER